MDWKVPLSDISFDEREEQAVIEVIKSRWLSMGSKTQLFEEKFAELTGSKYAIAVSNCTAAMHMSHLAMNVKPGDEVITPSLTFIATVNTILAAGAKPVFSDVESLDKWCIGVKNIEPLITSKTVGVAVVHYAGYPANMTEIVSLCRKHNLYLIEDCAHSVGTYWQGKHMGSFGKFGCFSFFSNKNMTTGEGGMLVTDDDQLAEKARLLRSHGMTTLTWQRHKGHASSYDVVLPGYNYRIDEIRSAIGLVQLSKLFENNKKRALLVDAYRRRLANTPNVSVPFAANEGKSSYHIFPILLDSKVSRSSVIAMMKEKGIQTSIHYPAAHLFTYMKSFLGTRENTLPLTEKISSNVLTLPLYPDMSFEQVATVVNSLNDCLCK
ncbi:MAG: DegT/DnrJ/EryC1/StrS aminotransferase [Planctomycetes bacterium GWC2_45_44]|nr:MAG: DegT/DnrJ/EryC1/StrS aminotransferase [Planctomycetes bacterium GWC2_45_44]HBR18954.1 DegT/DnrJ/EryC1/StrS aminotransferase [Phycisphaerales bacterium]